MRCIDIRPAHIVHVDLPDVLNTSQRVVIQIAYYQC